MTWQVVFVTYMVVCHQPDTNFIVTVLQYLRSSQWFAQENFKVLVESHVCFMQRRWSDMLHVVDASTARTCCMLASPGI
jgi:hypothetical protein